jgi:protein phosphatase
MTDSSRAAKARETAEPGFSPERKSEHPSSSLVEVELAAQSHTGHVRLTNQDSYLAVSAERSLRPLLSNLPASVLFHSVDETAYAMIVADGIGGMPAGDIASSLALRKLVDLVVKTPDWIMRINRRKAAVVKKRMAERFRQVDVALREYGATDPRLAGMGTTMTVACSLGADLFLGHLGDSRAYLQRADHLHQLTRDHTLAQAMIEAGVEGIEEDAIRGMRHVLTAAVGSTAPPSDPEVQQLTLMHGDQLLLCTDGLTESADLKIIAAILRDARSADEACRALIDAALRGGGTDNVTVILARYRFPQEAT